MLVPIDEILSINYVVNKDGQPAIVIKPTGKSELTLNFEWKFEAEVSNFLDRNVLTLEHQVEGIGPITIIRPLIQGLRRLRSEFSLSSL